MNDSSKEGTPRPPRFEEVANGEAVSRTAAHEAGHILAAWLSWAIASVDGTTFRKDIVSVEHTYKRPRTPVQCWESLVISSAGMAGEITTHRTFKTRNSRVDIEVMRMQIEQLTKHFGASVRPPWPEPGDHSAPPFETFFKEGLAPGWGELMRSAYRRAKDIILLHRESFERLRVAMLMKIELTPVDIEAALRMKKA